MENFNYNKIAIIKGEEVIRYQEIESDMFEWEITEMVYGWCERNGYDYDKDNFSWEYQEFSS
jgi:hypothetical protein